MYCTQFFLRFHSMQRKICNFSKFLKRLWQHCPLASYARKIILISCCKIIILHAKFCTILCIRIRDRTTGRILEKTIQQRPLLSYEYPNCIIISNDKCFVYKFLCNIIHQKPGSAYTKNFGKSVTMAPPVERFLPNVDRHKFMTTLNIKFH